MLIRCRFVDIGGVIICVVLDLGDRVCVCVCVCVCLWVC